MLQCFSASVLQCISASVLQCISGSVLQCFSSSVHQCFSASVHQCFSASGESAFALTLHPVAERIKRETSHLLINAWYLDDGTLCGTPDDLLRALNIVEEDGLARGLNLNRLKSLLHIPEGANDSHNPLPAEISHLQIGLPPLRFPCWPCHLL